MVSPVPPPPPLYTPVCDSACNQAWKLGWHLKGLPKSAILRHAADLQLSDSNRSDHHRDCLQKMVWTRQWWFDVEESLSVEFQAVGLGDPTRFQETREPRRWETVLRGRQLSLEGLLFQSRISRQTTGILQAAQRSVITDTRCHNNHNHTHFSFCSIFFRRKTGRASMDQDWT